MSIMDTIKDPFAGSRRAENEDKARFQAESDKLKDIGNTELEQYKNPTLSDTQKKELADYSGEMGAATKDFYSQAGKGGSSAELDSMKQWANDVSSIKFNMEELQKESSWGKAIQSLGMSQDAARRIIEMDQKDRAAKSQLLAGFMGAASGLIKMGV